jgi:hypothetical protein
MCQIGPEVGDKSCGRETSFWLLKRAIQPYSITFDIQFFSRPKFCPAFVLDDWTMLHCFTPPRPLTALMRWRLDALTAF